VVHLVSRRKVPLAQNKASNLKGSHFPQPKPLLNLKWRHNQTVLVNHPTSHKLPLYRNLRERMGTTLNLKDQCRPLQQRHTIIHLPSPLRNLHRA